MPPFRPLIALTQGDPAGIGPEVLLRALNDDAVRQAARCVIIGNLAVLRRVARKHRIPMPLLAPMTLTSALESAPGPFLAEAAPCPASLALAGKPSAESGLAAAAAVKKAVEMALAGTVQAVVTTPLSKEALHRAGVPYPGHTEMIAAQCKASRPVMMMVGGGLRVALVTTHAPMAALPQRVTRRAVYETILVTHNDLRIRFGVRRPRIAVCGLNPHAGEAGLFGKEEGAAIAPAVRAAYDRGLCCQGPFPADTLFIPQRRAQFDAIVAMYHDQGTIPVKMLAFESGVNATLGLPIIRTSPDHGTAYDIVRKGVAHPGSMIAAVLLAAEMAARA